MNELIAISETTIGGEVVHTVNARELWAFIGSGQEFATWIKGRIEKYGLVENEDFTIDKFVNGRATVIDYHLTIETGKELAMVENNDKGREVRRYFIECEKKAKQVSAPKELSRKDLALMILDAENEIERLALVVEAQAPKVAALDRIAQSSHEHNMRDGAKVLQIKPGTMSGWLKSLGWITKGNGSKWFAKQPTIDSGLMTMKEHEQEMEDGSVKIRPQAMITPKGMAKLAVMLSNNPNANNEV